jgi:hypothetical protein
LRRSKAFTIPVVLLVLVLVIVMGSTIAILSAGNQGLAALSIGGERAFRDSDQGLAELLSQVSSFGLANTTIPRTALPNGDAYSGNIYQAGQVAPDGTTVPANCYYVVSTGITTTGVARHAASMVHNGGGAFSVGAFAQTINATDNSSFDAYNSYSAGKHHGYSSTYVVTGQTVLGSNSTSAGAVYLSSGTAYNSESSRIALLAGADASSVVQYQNNGPYVPLKTTKLNTTPHLPDITPPNDPVYNTATSGSFGSSATVPIGNYTTLNITAGGNAAMSGNYIVGDLNAATGSQLTVGTGKTAIYVTNSINLADDVLFNSQAAAANLTIYYAGSDTNAVNIGAGDNAYFSLIAPNTTVTIGSPTNSAANLYGGVVANAIVMREGAFHYDMDLSGINSPLANSGNSLTILSTVHY